MHLLNIVTKPMGKNRFADKEAEMSSSRRGEERSNISDSAFSFSKAYEENLRHLKETMTVEDIFREVSVAPLTPLHERTPQDTLSPSSSLLSSDDDDDESDKDSENTDKADSSESSESESSGSVSSHSESEEPDSEWHERVPNRWQQEGIAQTNTTAQNLVSSRTPTVSPAEGRTTVLSVSDCGIKLKVNYPKSNNSNSQSPSFLSSMATNEHLDPVTVQSVMPQKSKKRQEKLPAALPVPSTASAVGSGGPGVDTVPGTGGTNPVPGSAPAVPQKKAPPSPRTLAKLTGLDFKPLPNISIGKKRQANNTKAASKSQRTEDSRRGLSALQRAYSPERNHENIKPVAVSNGESLEDELDATSVDFDSIDYNITERTTFSEDPLGLRRLAGDSGHCGTDKVDADGEPGDTGTKRSRKNIGDIWGSMVSQSQGPTEEFRDREPFSRHAATKSRRNDYNSRRRDWNKPSEENGHSRDSHERERSSHRERDRERDWERSRDRSRGRSRDRSRERSRGRSRDRSRDRSRERDRERDRERGRDRRSRPTTKSVYSQTENDQEENDRSNVESMDSGCHTYGGSNSENKSLEQSSVYSNRASELENLTKELHHAKLRQGDQLTHWHFTDLVARASDVIPKIWKNLLQSDSRTKMFISTHWTIVLVQESCAMQKEKANPKALSTKLRSLGNICKGNEEAILVEMKKEVLEEDRTWAILHIITLQVQSYACFRFWLSRRNDIEKLRSVIDSFVESNDVRVNLTKDESLALKNYVHYTHWVNRSQNYMDRADLYMQKSGRVMQFFKRLRQDVGHLLMNSSLNFFVRYISEALQRLGYQHSIAL